MYTFPACIGLMVLFRACLALGIELLRKEFDQPPLLHLYKTTSQGNCSIGISKLETEMTNPADLEYILFTKSSFHLC